MSEFPPEPLLLEPFLSPRPWGGRRWMGELGKEAGTDEPIGESWELSDHPHGRSRVASGAFAGEFFGDVMRRFPREMIGRVKAPERYPLLVKFIDAGSDLSIQVHPDDHFAAVIDPTERGKTECWYVMACAPHARIIHGLQAGITAEELRAGAAGGRIEQMVSTLDVRPHDFLFVPPGTVHAILGGTLVCEIQQASDATYRLWDWNREPKRELHVEQALEVIGFHHPPPPPRSLAEPGSYAQPVILTHNAFFRVRLLDLPAMRAVAIPSNSADSGLIAVCVAGEAILETAGGEKDLACGRTAFLPAVCGTNARLRAAGDGPARVLLAESREL